MFSTKLFQSELKEIGHLLKGGDYEYCGIKELYDSVLTFQQKMELKRLRQSSNNIIIDEHAPYIEDSLLKARFSTSAYLGNYSVARHWSLNAKNEGFGENYIEMYLDDERDTLVQMKLYRWCGHWYTEAHPLLIERNIFYYILAKASTHKLLRKLPLELIRMLVYFLNY